MYPRIVVGGDRNDRAEQYGRAAQGRIRTTIGLYRSALRHYAGWEWDEVRSRSERFIEPIASYRQGTIEEMESLATGAGVPFDDVLALNCRTELVFSALVGRELGRPPECTSLAFSPEATVAGQTLLAQNWDWLPGASEALVVLEAEATDGPSYATVVEAGLLAKCGCNSDGLGVVTNALATDEDDGRAGVPYHVILRAIYDCSSAAEAVEVIERADRASSANYMIAHRDGAAIDIEAAPHQTAEIGEMSPARGRLCHSNHFLAARVRRDVELEMRPDSVARLDRAAALAAAPTAIDRRDVERILRDHANFPSSVCCHPEPSASPWDTSRTAVSIIMDLDGPRVWVASGNPCSTEFVELTLGGWVTTPHAGASRTLAG
jgi:isopenicillin-N N-acyltransferase-like protein